ncbi:hypothetical protein SERLA73DRAFT_101193 [Serpula lacrymans var. lacrymans S7.3]|uniref:MOSC domain-containing protein n=2 Tax=Serpula lacrymans var. lacrymans TaxID=341189 RepID=F8PGE6_SERL3|nr:uncharacterized protein SERLADRAFT_359247 [Serpula lacrymans var. lacrymans S7.9]EGO05379.1 hypothetical protein SERLA73DRAFT_101193 [Serpula lacrymans var. lacrymans S7.3]EGO31228.1 hypothetical protein SERLADRAFT_359247 [Serpula lacrymans var. lacrymans S7.9]
MTFQPLVELRLVSIPSASITVLLFAAPLLYAYLSWKPTKSVETSRAPTPTKVLSLPSFDASNIRVSKLLVHPIKSCRGTSVQQANYTPQGIENDRKWCIIKAETHFVLTARACSKMVLIHPEIVEDSSSPDCGFLKVSFPEDSESESFSVPLKPSEETLQSWKTVSNVELWGRNDIDGYICESLSGRSPSDILSAYVGYPVLLVMKGPRPRLCAPTLRYPKLGAPTAYQDGFPLLVVSEESIMALQTRVRDMVGVQGVDEKWSQEKIDVERFRPNIVLKGAGIPFAEDSIAEFTIDSHREVTDSTAPIIRLVCKCTRCLLPNVDIRTGLRDKAVPYKVLMKFRKGLDPAQASKACMGCNGAPSGSGTVKVGDWIHVHSRDDV